MTSLETDPIFYKNFSEELLKKRNEQDNKILFFSVAGSHSFNLNVETSDSDYFGVYSSDLDKILSGNNKVQTLDCHDPDYVLFEAEKFCELIYKGNPKLIEPLFSNYLCYQSNDWLDLIKDRKRFISLSAIRHYLSYAKFTLMDAIKIKEQSDKQKKQQPQQEESVSTLLNNLSLSSNHSHHKKLYHTLRILLEANRMIEGGQPLVYLTGSERDRIMDIRLGKSNIETLLKEINDLFEQSEKRYDEIKESNSIQQVCSVEFLSDWLVNLRINSFIESESIKESIKFKSSDFILDGNEPWKKDIISKYKQLLKDSGIEDDAHLLMIKSSGSHSHGLNDDDNDNNNNDDDDESKDWIGVYVSNTNRYLSLYTPPTRIDKHNSNQHKNNGKISKFESTTSTAAEQRDTYVRGIQLFEVGSFLSLLELGNHRAVECLNSKESIESLCWKELISKNINYNSLNLIMHYWGVSQGNIGKAQNSKLPLIQRQKLLYHSLRLILYAKSLLESKSLLFEFNEKDKLKLLLLKSNKEMDIEQFNQMYNEIKETISQVGNLLSKKEDNNTKQKKENNLNLKNSHSDWLVKLRKSLITTTTNTQ